MRKVILSVFSTLLVIGLLLGGFVLYIRGYGFSAREQPTWMEKTMARKELNQPATTTNGRDDGGS